MERFLVMLGAVALAFSAAAGEDKEELTVFAAASLTDIGIVVHGSRITA